MFDDSKAHAHASVPIVPFKWEAYVMLAGLLGLAAVLRLFTGLDRVLWYDELQSVAHSAQAFLDVPSSVFQHDPHPSLYYLQLQLWMNFGTSEAWLRLNSVAWSLSALVPIYLVGRRLLGSAGGFWAAFIFALSPVAIYFAQEVRMYAMQMSLVAFNLLFLERVLQNARRFDLGLFFITLVAIIYTHGAGFLVLVPVALYSVLRVGWGLVERQSRGLSLSLVAAAICSLPWLFNAHGTRLNQLKISSFEEIPGVLLELLLGPYADTSSAAVLLLFMTVAAGLLVILMTEPRLRDLTTAYVLGPFVVILALAYFVTPLWNIKALAWLLPALSIVVAGVIVVVQERIGGYKRAVSVFSAIIIVACLLPSALSVNRNTGFRNMYYDMARYLARSTRPGDMIVTDNWRDYWALSWYLAGSGSVAPAENSRLAHVPNDRLLVKVDVDDRSANGVWRVARSATWPDPVQSAPEFAPDARYFGWLLAYQSDQHGPEDTDPDSKS